MGVLGRAKPQIVVLAVSFVALLTAAVVTATPLKNVAAPSLCNTSGAAPGVSPTTITVGTTMPLSGSSAGTGVGVKQGQLAYYKYLNDHGGVKGRKINDVILDDQLNPSIAVQQIRLLDEQDHVFVISGGAGTPNFLAELPYIDSQNIPTIAPYAPTSYLGTMKYPHIWMINVNYIIEDHVLASYILKHFGPLKPSVISLVSVPGDVGNSIKAGLEDAIKGTNIKLQVESETPGTTNFSSIVSQLKTTNAPWTFIMLTAGDTGNLLKAMREQGYTPRSAAGWAGMVDASYLTPYASVSQGMIVPLETTPLTVKDPAIQTFEREYQQVTGSAPTVENAEGWVQAELTALALKKAPALTRSCVEYGLEQFRNVKTGLYPPISFGPTTRMGVNAVGIAEIQGNNSKILANFATVGS